MAKKKGAVAPTKVDLKAVFGGLQDQLLAELNVPKAAIKHAPTQGSVTESRWLRMLNAHLPTRYCATSGFVIDSTGALSNQIDLIVYDRHYSPFILNEEGVKYVTAESIYGVFEIKPELTPANLIYAGNKVASVRALKRTSAPIYHAGGVHPPKALTPIVGGILTMNPGWKKDYETRLAQELLSLAEPQRLDLGCVLTGRSFDMSYEPGEAPVVATDASVSLVFFLLRLLGRLQKFGTVAAIDLGEYSKQLSV